MVATSAGLTSLRRIVSVYEDIETEFIEPVLVRLDGYYSQGGTPSQGNRLYFDPTDIVKGRRVIGVEIQVSTAAFIYQGVICIGSNTIRRKFTITFTDIFGNEIIKDLPIQDLNVGLNGNNMRVFSFIPDITKCYITRTDANGAFGTNQGLLFNFYTRSK